MGRGQLQNRKPDEAVKVFEDILGEARKNDNLDQIIVLLYDIGFACLRAEKTDQAYEHWNNLYQLDRNYKKVKQLITSLRQEMDLEVQEQAKIIGISVIDFIDDWIEDAFPPGYIWDICGLKSKEKY